MSATNSLTIFTKAALMLAEADTVQKAKELKDLAITAGEWAKRKGMGEEAILHCRSYALEAERVMGQLLIAGKADGTVRTRGRRPKTTHREVLEIQEIGLSHKESAEAQMLAEIPVEDFDRIKSGNKTKAKAKKERKARKDREQMEQAAKEITAAKAKSLLEVCNVRYCSCAELFASGIKPDAVITDPPYPEKFLPVFSELAEACKDVPLVAVMVGQSYLPEVLRRLCEHLKYRWTLAYLTPGGQAVQQFPAKVNTFWKPVLLFGKAAEWIGDVTRSDVNDNDKDHHHWGQSESGMADLVQRLTKPGQLVCDPFCGGGSTAVVALGLNRRFVGSDVDKKAVAETLLRVSALK